MLYSVITTIAQPTHCVKELSKLQKMHGLGPLVVAGDKKGPASFELENARFLSLAEQHELFPEFAELLPIHHYARKNIGYLFAMKDGATCIYETDDDNRPNADWQPREIMVKNPKVARTPSAWINVYQHFTDEQIWPRGLPLDFVRQDTCPLEDINGEIEAPIQQGLVDNSADVDAVWRLLFDRPFEFDPAIRHSVVVPQNVWSPFNTQSTWWWPVAYPLMYVPSFCSFRMCDIWKSFVAQRCLWEMDCGIVYHAPEVIQDRNPHDLMKDFEDEVPGYLQNKRIADYLSSTNLLSGRQNMSDNLRKCYEELVAKGIFPKQELDLVYAWCKQVETLG